MEKDYLFSNVAKVPTLYSNYKRPRDFNKVADWIMEEAQMRMLK